MGKLKKRFAIASVGILFFYTSIGMGIVWFYLSYYGFKRFQTKK